MGDFGLDDFRLGGKAGPRRIRMHVMFLQQARRMKVPTGGIFTVAEVAKRDRWLCSACGGPVLQRWSAGELDRAPALDFARPWADGGRYDQANARLAHFGCAMFPGKAFAGRLGRLLTRDMTVKARAAAGDEACTKGHPLSGANLLNASDGHRRCRQCRKDRESGALSAAATAGRA